MPRVKEIKPYISKLAEDIKDIGGVRSVYIWGSYYRNNKNPDFRVKDIDIIAKTHINSEDLVSVDNDIINKLCTKKYLEERGYDPKAVEFSKNFINLIKHNIDHCAISSDNKLLHRGEISVNREESDEVNKMAEKHAAEQTGKNRKKINKSSEANRKNWYKYYNNYINSYFGDMPTGWYLSNVDNIKEILDNAMKI